MQLITWILSKLLDLLKKIVYSANTSNWSMSLDIEFIFALNIKFKCKEK